MEHLELDASVSKDSKSRAYLRKIRAKDERRLGSEPEWTVSSKDKADDIKYKAMRIFNWYSHSFEAKHAKEWIIDYLHSKNADQKTISAVNVASCFSNTAGWIARLLLRGAKKLPKHYTKHLIENIEKMRLEGQEVLDKNVDKLKKLQEGRVKAIQKLENVAKKLTDKHLSEFDYQIDELIISKFKKNEFSPEKYLQDHSVTKEQAKTLSEHLSRYLNELKAVLKKEDEQLVEAYENYTKKQLTTFKDFVQTSIEACNTWEEKAPEKVKTNRKPRKKKVKPASLQVKKLFFAKDYKEYGLLSVSPEKVIGAMQLWVFNTKYRYLGVYNACDSAGFSVKGSTLKNFDRATSIEKKIRKPKEILKATLEGGKIALRKLLPDIKAKERKLTGRINANTILLRIV